MGRYGSDKGSDYNKKGQPADRGVNRVGLKDPHLERLEEDQKMEEKYTDGEDEPAENVHKMHHNRNLNKPDIDKPSYS